MEINALESRIHVCRPPLDQRIGEHMVYRIYRYLCLLSIKYSYGDFDLRLNVRVDVI